MGGVEGEHRHERGYESDAEGDGSLHLLFPQLLILETSIFNLNKNWHRNCLNFMFCLSENFTDTTSYKPMLI